MTQPQSGKTLCLVLILGGIFQRILGYKGSTENSPVNSLMIGTSQHYLRDSEMLKHISNTVDNMDGLGFKGKDTGTHYIHSSLVMALYLVKRPVCTIMLIG